jgi:hypothetical protein
MTNTLSAQQASPIERMILSIDDGAFGALYRTAIGFATLPAISLLLGRDHADWVIVPFLLAILLLLRIIPAIIRKLLPFSGAARDIWTARRRVAKRHDSYQWRKLTWIAVGLSLYTAISGQISAARIILCAVCLLAGLAAELKWRAVSGNVKLV